MTETLERFSMNVRVYRSGREIPDMRDLDIANVAYEARQARKGPLVGDVVRFPDGHIERFTHDWGDDIQTGGGGSFHLDHRGACAGIASYSGGLNAPVLKSKLAKTAETMEVDFWIFHHGFATAHAAIGVVIPVPIYQLEA